jgi:hypothetical protein
VRIVQQNRDAGGVVVMTRVRPDFDGLFGELLCLSHLDVVEI